MGKYYSIWVDAVRLPAIEGAKWLKYSCGG